jgi:hypothetical protein
VNNDKIWTIRKKSRLIGEKIGKIWKNPKLNSEKIWKIRKKVFERRLILEKVWENDMRKLVMLTLYFKRCGTGTRYAEKVTLHFKHCISNVAN